jgi:ADP-heptose:LPS heptosyltransferase
MRIVEIIKSFTHEGKRFEAGHKFVMAEDVESNYRTVAGDSIGMSHPIESVYRPYKGEDLNGKRLMTWRTGGIGDIFFLNPVLRYLKKKYPTSFIRVASGCKQPLENVPEIDQLQDMPFDAKLLNDVDYMLQYQGIIEGESAQSKMIHATDMFFSYFGIDSIQFPMEEKVPKLFFTKEEMTWLKSTLTGLGIEEKHYVVGIQMETSSPLRNYPKEKLKPIIDILAQEENVKVVLIGNEQHHIISQFYKGNSPNVTAAIKFTVRQSIVLATRYDLIIAPDSFMIQVGGALEKPLIGLYGPFASEVRMKYFKNSIGLDPSVVCSPCFKHDFRPCVKGFPSPCFTQISVEDLLQAIDYQKNKFTGRHFKYMAEFLREPDLSEIEQYLLSADKGLAFFPRYFRHHNMITVDVSPFTKPDITDLQMNFTRESHPFVIFFNELQPKYINLYNNSKGLVRPGGYFIVYKNGAIEALFNDVKTDLGKNFTLMYSKLDPVKNVFIVVGKKPY